jgi:hypothetical protein
LCKAATVSCNEARKRSIKAITIITVDIIHRSFSLSCSEVGRATGYGLYDQGIGVRVSVLSKTITFLYKVRGFLGGDYEECHPLSYVVWLL